MEKKVTRYKTKSTTSMLWIENILYVLVIMIAKLMHLKVFPNEVKNYLGCLKAALK